MRDAVRARRYPQQEADAVCHCMDWRYVLRLDLSDSRIDFTMLHDFRWRWHTHEAGQQFLDTFLAACKARGWVKARRTQRTDSTPVLAAIRTLHRLEGVLGAMHWALNQLSEVAPTVLSLDFPRAGSAPLTHEGRATTLSGAHRLSL